jgi:hypothetical protein
MKIQPIKQGFCPKCNCEIAVIDGNSIKPNNLYTEVWILFDDGSNVNHAICKKCLENLTIEDARKIQQMQRYTWGLEILDSPLSLKALYMQLTWYISCGAILEVIKFAKIKEELMK